MAHVSEQPYFGIRLLAVKLIACLWLSLLLVRLWYLQGINGAYYRDLSENNRIRAIRTEAPRGNMFDRDGRLLVHNRPAFNVALMLEDTPHVNETIRKLAEITGRDAETLLAQFVVRKAGRRFEPQVVMYDISREELAKVKVNTLNLPGVIITEVPTRAYPNASVAAQLFGYAREITKTQLENLRDKGYRQGDTIGQFGLEKQFEEVLRGRSGYVQVEVDAAGNRRDELGIVDALPGNDIYLTIDIDLQRAAEEGLANRRGAVVAIDPRNGEVLALASGPSFDANLFAGQIPAKEWERLTQDRNRPLQNRAISNAYPPGSTSKMLWAVAALAERKVSPSTVLSCPGFVILNNRRYHCHKKVGHGGVDLARAIMVSCNAYFYQVGHMLGITNMTKYLDMFGFGQPTGIELPGEEKGTCPSEQWKLEAFHERWYPGDSVPISIGQGYLIVTPIQMANLMAAIAADGKRFKPTLVKRVVNTQTGELTEHQPEPIAPVLQEQKKIFEKIRALSVEVVNSRQGTGWRAKIEGVPVGGKTGTAQVVRLGSDAAKDHAWFIAFGPADNPMIAMAVVVENVGHGGEFSAPIARGVFEAYFRKLGILPQPVPPPEQPAAPAETPPEEDTESTGEEEQPAQ